MLIRIVRLTLQPDAVQSFYRVFAETAPKIRQAKGCRKLELWVDAEYSNIITTYSEWDSESHLNTYRESALSEMPGQPLSRCLQLQPSPTAISLKKLPERPRVKPALARVDPTVAMSLHR